MISLYLINKKGYEVLKHILSNDNYKNLVSKVFLAQDKGNSEDYYYEMFDLCKKNDIDVFDRKENVLNDSTISLAIGWRWLIKESKRLIVIHDSLLPKYRGFAPLVNMLINGEKHIGATMIFANEKIDEGDVIKQLKYKINYPIKISKAIDTVSHLYVELVENLFNKLCLNEEILGVEQNNSLASYSIWRDSKDYLINWETSPESIKRFVDAVGHPYSGAKINYCGFEIIIDEVEIVQITNEIEHFGKILSIKNNQPIVLCKGGAIKIIKSNYNGDVFIFNKTRVRL